MMHDLVMYAGLATATIFLAGCLDGTIEGASTPNVPIPAPTSPRDTNQGFDIETRYAMAAAGMSMGDMAATRFAEVPLNSSDVTLTVTWTPGTGFGSEQNCMLHDGSGQTMGVMLAAQSGKSPLSVGPANLTESVSEIGVMCWADGNPAVGVNQVVHVRVVFGRTG